jgi:hypothetical protein
MQLWRAKQSLAAAVMLVTSLTGIVPAFAQQVVSAATLSGRVEDTNGAAISGASIAITNIDKNQTTSSTSDDHGRYSFLYLPVGSYQLKIEHHGFAPVTRKLILTVGQAIDLPVRLEVAGLRNTAEIFASPPVGFAGKAGVIASELSPSQVAWPREQLLSR